MNLSFHTALHISTITFFHFGALPCSPWPVHLPPQPLVDCYQVIIAYMPEYLFPVPCMSISTFHNVACTYTGCWFHFSVKSDCQSDCHFTEYGLIYPDKALQQLQWLRVSTWFLWQAAFLKRKLTENRGRSKMSNNVSWNHRYIYLIYWPTWMRHFLCILRQNERKIHILCSILLFEYVNMRPKIYIFNYWNMSWDPPKMTVWLGVQFYMSRLGGFLGYLHGLKIDLYV